VSVGGEDVGGSDDDGGSVVGGGGVVGGGCGASPVTWTYTAWSPVRALVKLIPTFHWPESTSQPADTPIDMGNWLGGVLALPQPDDPAELIQFT
jgi:hypothetical protein